MLYKWSEKINCSTQLISRIQFTKIIDKFTFNLTIIADGLAGKLNIKQLL